MNGKRMIIQWVAAISFLAAVCPRIANAEIGPIGPEIQVNQTTEGDQSYPAASMDDAGNFVVVWLTDNSVDQCDSPVVMARLYNPDGTPRTDEFRVNQGSLRTGGYFPPDVAMNADGDFVVVWTAGTIGECMIPPCPCTPLHPDGDESAIIARRYNLNGVAQGDEFVVNEIADEVQRRPSVGIDGAGNFTVAWEWEYTTIDPAGDDDIYMRRFNTSGTPITNDIMVNDPVADPEMLFPTIAMNRSGRFVIGWDYECGTCDLDAVGKIFDSSGTEIIGEFLFNTFTNSGQSGLDIAINQDGSFIAAWSSNTQDPDGSGGAYAQLFDELATKVGPEINVNQTIPFGQAPEGIGLFSGEFIISLYDTSVSFQYDLLYRKYLYSGSPLSDEIRATTTTAGWQMHGVWASNASNNASFVWQSNDQDGSGWGIYMRQFGEQQTAVPVTSNSALWAMSVVILVMLIIFIKRRKEKCYGGVSGV